MENNCLKVRIFEQSQDGISTGPGMEGYLHFMEFQLNPFNEAEITKGFHLGTAPESGGGDILWLTEPLFEPKVVAILNGAIVFEGWHVVMYHVQDRKHPGWENHPEWRVGVKAGEVPFRWTIFPM